MGVVQMEDVDAPMRVVKREGTEARDRQTLR